MEDIFGYAILFTVGLSLVIAWQWRKTRVSELPLSVQIFPEVKLKVSVKKHEGKVSLLIVGLTSKTNQLASKCSVELIDRKRQFISIDAVEIDPEMKARRKKDDENQYIFLFDFILFKKYLTDLDAGFRTFRFVVEAETGKKYKSHDLAFNKNWTVYKPDSGKYN